MNIDGWVRCERRENPDLRFATGSHWDVRMLKGKIPLIRPIVFNESPDDEKLAAEVSRHDPHSCVVYRLKEFIDRQN